MSDLVLKGSPENHVSLFAKKPIEKLTHEEKVETLSRISSYLSAETFDPSEFGKEPLSVVGVLCHPVSIRQEKTYLDRESGDVQTEEYYVDAVRTVFRLEDGRYIGFVSIAAEQFARNFLIPMFGAGDWEKPVKIRVVQLSKQGGRRTYNFAVVKE